MSPRRHLVNVVQTVKGVLAFGGRSLGMCPNTFQSTGQRAFWWCLMRKLVLKLVWALSACSFMMLLGFFAPVPFDFAALQSPCCHREATLGGIAGTLV